VAYYRRGNALKDLKRPAEALASYDKAIALKPDYAFAYYRRGDALKDLQRPAEALASYDKAIALKPDIDRRDYPVKPKQGLVFIHIPRSGGTSVHDFLAATVPLEPKPDLAARLAQFSSPLYPLYKHTKGRELRDILGETTWMSVQKLCIVRNPWDQMVSSYNWWLQKATPYWRHHEWGAEVAELRSFDAFLSSRFGRECINEWEGNPLDWFTDEDGTDIVDFVARFETLERDLHQFCESARLVPRNILPHLNATERSSYRDYYNSNTRRIVASRFSDLINRFGYQF
jgi:tetratricopeptide (TPR) repeat protein